YHFGAGPFVSCVHLMRSNRISIALLACDAVGLEVARIFRDRGDRVALLVLDRRDERGTNQAIRETVAADVIVDDAKLPDELLAQVDVALLAWWPRIITKERAALPRRGFLNF